MALGNFCCIFLLPCMDNVGLNHHMGRESCASSPCCATVRWSEDQGFQLKLTDLHLQHHAVCLDFRKM